MVFGSRGLLGVAFVVLMVTAGTVKFVLDTAIHPLLNLLGGMVMKKIPTLRQGRDGGLYALQSRLTE